MILLNQAKLSKRELRGVGLWRSAYKMSRLLRLTQLSFSIIPIDLVHTLQKPTNMMSSASSSSMSFIHVAGQQYRPILPTPPRPNLVYHQSNEDGSFSNVDNPPKPKNCKIPKPIYHSPHPHEESKRLNQDERKPTRFEFPFAEE